MAHETPLDKAAKHLDATEQHMDAMASNAQRLSDIAEWALKRCRHLEAVNAELLEALGTLLSATGRTGWQNASPVASERKTRAEMLNMVRDAIAKAKATGEDQ